jgi:hypothetical protein
MSKQPISRHISLALLSSLIIGYSVLGAENLGAPKTDSVIITNPQHAPVPDQKVRVLHRLVREVVANQLHLHGSSRGAPLELILGQDTEQLKLAGTGESDLIYLKTWDETKFVVSDMQLIVQHLLVNDRWEQMMDEISRRAALATPVTIGDLKNAKVPPLTVERISGDPCAQALRDASARTTPCAIRPIY